MHGCREMSTWGRRSLSGTGLPRCRRPWNPCGTRGPPTSLSTILMRSCGFRWLPPSSAHGLCLTNITGFSSCTFMQNVLLEQYRVWQCEGLGDELLACRSAFLVPSSGVLAPGEFDIEFDIGFDVGFRVIVSWKHAGQVLWKCVGSGTGGECGGERARCEGGG